MYGISSRYRAAQFGERFSRKAVLASFVSPVALHMIDLRAVLDVEGECVVHDDLQPRNVVVDGGQLGLVDWEQLRPLRRINDVAQLWWSVAVGPPEFEIAPVGARWRRVLDMFGTVDRAQIVAVAIEKIHRCIDDIVEGASAGSERHRALLERYDHRELQRLVGSIERRREQLVELIE